MIDRTLAILGFILGLPGFVVLFFTPYQAAGIIAALLGMSLVATAIAIHKLSNRSLFKMNCIDVVLDFKSGPELGQLTKTYRIVATAKGVEHMSHRNIAADGEIRNIRWDGEVVPDARIRRLFGAYEVSVPLRPTPIRGKEFPGCLSYELVNSFPGSRESLAYVVDFPSKVVNITASFPRERPVRNQTARLVFAGNEKDLGSDLKASDGKLSLSVTSPTVGSEVWIYWDW